MTPRRVRRVTLARQEDRRRPTAMRPLFALSVRFIPHDGRGHPDRTLTVVRFARPRRQPLLAPLALERNSACPATRPARTSHPTTHGSTGTTTHCERVTTLCLDTRVSMDTNKSQPSPPHTHKPQRRWSMHRNTRGGDNVRAHSGGKGESDDEHEQASRAIDSYTRRACREAATPLRSITHTAGQHHQL